MRKCEWCGKSAVYCEEHDAYFCEGCDCWIEPKCFHEECEFCKDRPEKPPVKPVRNFDLARLSNWFCGHCLENIKEEYKFCPECSRKIYWEEARR